MYAFDTSVSVASTRFDITLAAYAVKGFAAEISYAPLVFVPDFRQMRSTSGAIPAQAPETIVAASEETELPPICGPLCMITVSPGSMRRTRVPRLPSIFSILDLPNLISSDEVFLFVALRVLKQQISTSPIAPVEMTRGMIRLFLI